MSGTAPVSPTFAARILEWSRPIIAMMLIVLFAAAFVGALVLKSENILNILVGAIVAGFSTIVGYYFGSSTGSEKKDAVIAAQLAPPPVQPPHSP